MLHGCDGSQGRLQEIMTGLLTTRFQPGVTVGSKAILGGCQAAGMALTGASWSLLFILYSDKTYVFS